MWGAMFASEYAPAQTAANSSPWHYAFLPGSTLTDDCYCGRLAVLAPLQGGFDLRWLETTPLNTRYVVTNLAGVAAVGGRSYRLAGHGVYEIGGEVSVRQSLSLELRIDDGVTNQLCFFTNDTATVERPWPMLKAHLDQTNGTIGQFYRLDWAAAPFRELWFSTAHSLTASLWSSPTNLVSAGDLLAATGRVVRRNQALTALLGIMPPVPDLGLDALEVLPGGEIAFSVAQAQRSERSGIGWFYDGDVLSERGRVVLRYQDLLAAFSPMPPVADPGLDAFQRVSSNEFYFSIKTNFYSQRLGKIVRRGDLLSSTGRIVQSNEGLVAGLRPADSKQDYGLDAFYVWPGGEVWFSTETGFAGSHFETYQPGDLLSSLGYVVFRNRDLVAPFSPLEDLTDFGLDALFVLTDLTPVPPPPRLSAPRVNSQTGDLSLQWTGSGQVFQLEKATEVTGPWLPLQPADPATNLTVIGLGTNTPRAFYRLRQW